MSFVTKTNRLCSEKLFSLNTKKFPKLLVDSFFSGGVITSTCKDEKVKDYDLFFIREETAVSVIQYYLGFHPWGKNIQLAVETDPVNPKLKRGKLISTNNFLTLEEFIEDFNKHFSKKKLDSGTIQPQFVSHNALSFNNGVQLIFRFIGEPEEVFTTFDFEHCKTYWRPCPLGVKKGEVKFLGKSLESLAKNELVYTGNTRFVLSAISRLNKFVKRGWGVAPSSLLALATSTAKVDWSSKLQLEEELLGIYGIDPKTLKQILELPSKDEKVDLDKVIQVLGEV